MSRYISEAVRKKVAGGQYFKCGNKPGSKNAINGYNCLLWKLRKNRGSFDASGYVIDHIEEYCLAGNNRIDNLQALCANCHAYKTSTFMIKHNIKKNNNINE